MDWTKILADAGIPEPPGRAEAIELAKADIAARYARTGPKRIKGSTTRKVKKVPRMNYAAARQNTTSS